jgi:hypothetical protein
VRQTQAHRGQILWVQPLQQTRQLLPDPSVEVQRRRVADDLDAQLLRDRTSELCVSDDEGLLDAGGFFGLLAVCDLVDEELGEYFGELAVLELGQVLDRVGGGRETVDGFELEAEGRGMEGGGGRGEV